jgi:hypothetical protein
MTKYLSIVAASSALAIGGLGFSSLARADEPANQPTANQPEKNQPGSAGAGNIVDLSARPQSPDAKEIRKVLSEATSAAVQGKFSDMAKRFSDSDRKRLGHDLKDNDQLKERFSQFQQDWKAKYNQDFDSGNIQLALDNAGFQVFQGQLFDQARTASEKLTPDVSAADSTNSDNAQAKTADAAGGAADRSANGDPSDKKMATAVVAASHDLPAVSIHLKNEGTVGDSWKIEIPQSLDAQKINDGLQRHLAMITDQKDSWPSDVNDAYRLVSHHVLASLSTTDSMTQPAQDKAGR